MDEERGEQRESAGLLERELARALRESGGGRCLVAGNEQEARALRTLVGRDVPPIVIVD